MKKLLSITVNTQNFQTVKKGKKTYRGFQSQKEHNKRIENIDEGYLLREELQHLNINYENELYLTQKDIENEMELIEEDYRNYYKRKMPKNYKPLLNGLITFSETMQEDIYKYGIEAMQKQIGLFLKNEYGKVVSLDLHMDETTPHFHFQVINYDYDKHKTHSAILEQSLKSPNNEMRINYTQDRLAAHLKKTINGFDYERGEIKSIKQYHNQRKAQMEHLKRLEQKTKEQEQELQMLRNKTKKQQKELDTLQDKLNSLKADYQGLIFKYETMESTLKEEYQEAILEILEDLEELGNENDAIKFLGLVVRYTKGEQARKLHNLIGKYGKKIQGVNRRKTQRQP